MIIDNAVLLGAALELLFANSQPTEQLPDTIIQTSSNKIIKPVMLDGFNRPYLKFVLEYVLMYTQEIQFHISR